MAKFAQGICIVMASAALTACNAHSTTLSSADTAGSNPTSSTSSTPGGTGTQQAAALPSPTIGGTPTSGAGSSTSLSDESFTGTNFNPSGAALTVKVQCQDSSGNDVYSTDGTNYPLEAQNAPSTSPPICGANALTAGQYCVSSDGTGLSIALDRTGDGECGALTCTLTVEVYSTAALQVGVEPPAPTETSQSFTLPAIAGGTCGASQPPAQNYTSPACDTAANTVSQTALSGMVQTIVEQISATQTQTVYECPAGGCAQEVRDYCACIACGFIDQTQAGGALANGNLFVCSSTGAGQGAGSTPQEPGCFSIEVSSFGWE